MTKKNTNLKTGMVLQSVNYGDFEVIEYINSSKVHIRFLDTGFECISSAGNIRSGGVRDYLKRNVLKLVIKEAYIKGLAEVHKDKISAEVYVKLKNWIVE